jgi:chloride channel protein, CIC family
VANGSQPRREADPGLLVDAIVLGVVGAIAAQLFRWLLEFCQWLFLIKLAGYRPPGLPGEGGPASAITSGHAWWLIPAVTTVGGLLSGYLVYSFASEAEGHGTDTAVRAFHRAGGFIRRRVAPLKMLASAITIGSGGSAGREGPTALIAAGFGSVYAHFRHRNDAERRLLVLVGMASGLSAIFRSPIGTALFAVEVLYSSMEFEASALIYTLLGSVVAYAINGAWIGWKPLFTVPQGLAVTHAVSYVWYAALGAASGLIATLLPQVFYGLRDMFRRLPMPDMFKPAIGGLGVGLIAVFLPQVLGGGYGWIQQAIDGRIAVGLLAGLLFAKMAAFALTVGSGGSGGVFAPSLYVGAMLGGLLAAIFHQPMAAFVVVGMAAVFGGAARIPLATLMMVTEMTGGYDLLVPAGLAILLSYLVQGRLSTRLKYRSLYEGQVRGRAQSPAHYVEHMRIAMALLRQRQVPHEATVNHLSLVGLLESGIPVDLPEKKQLLIGTLPPDHRCAGQTLHYCVSQMGIAELEVVAVLRDSQVLLPDPETTLFAGDRLLLIVSAETQERVRGFLSVGGSETQTGGGRS